MEKGNPWIRWRWTIVLQWLENPFITHRRQQPSISNTKLGISELYYWALTGTKKCVWYCISWKCNPDGTPTMSDNTSYNITLIDSVTQQHHTITQLPIHPLFKYLGRKSTPLGTIKHQFNSNKKHPSRGALIISSSKINRFHISPYN